MARSPFRARTVIASLLADAVLVLHVLFVLFVVLGGLLLVRWPRAAWVHVPCALWGGVVEIMGWICPLTPLENHFRRVAGRAGYSGGFLAHYVVPVLYPSGLTREIQVGLGIAVVVFNVAVYAAWWRRRRSG